MSILNRNLAFDSEIYERRADICKVLANPIRLRILDLIHRGTCSVSELRRELRISEANLSQHLGVLKGAGMVVTRREGKHTRCYLPIPETKKICDVMSDVLRAQVKNDQRFGG